MCNRTPRLSYGPARRRASPSVTLADGALVDVREEHHVGRQLLELRHQVESVVPQHGQGPQLLFVDAAVGRGEVGQGDGIEAVISQEDESEPLERALPKSLERHQA